ncbi:MAG: triose-phosphate isomerase [Bacteroidales bacterium]
MRKQIVAGNWKMNKTFSEAELLITDIADALDDADLKNAEVILCPPALYLEMTTDVAFESRFKVGAQNVYPEDSGAFTGEISPVMLKELNISYCITGHSERRKYFLESNEFLKRKVDALLKHEISPIFCCGEVLPEREAGRHFEVVKTQLTESLFHLSSDQFLKVVIAYEPVWAIGTGVTASNEQAQEMHAYIRGLIADKYSSTTANETTILYGGSCNGKNARELFAQPDVDGGLIGGASLKAEEFLQIATSF